LLAAVSARFNVRIFQQTKHYTFGQANSNSSKSCIFFLRQANISREIEARQFKQDGIQYIQIHSLLSHSEIPQPIIPKHISVYMGA